MKKIMLTNHPVLIVVFMLLAASGLGYSATNYYVWRNNPSPAPPFTNWAMAATNIQAAVDLTLSGDTVIVTNGTYDTGGAITPGYALTNRVCVNSKNITIRSVNGAEQTIIKGKPDDVTGACGPAAIRCVYLKGSSSKSSLSGFTLTNGCTMTSGDTYYDRSGGGVLIDNLSGSAGGYVSNCVIAYNKANYAGGGAMFYSGGAMSNCTLTANSATNSTTQAFGGGAYFTYGGMNNCTLNCNTSSYGGALYFNLGGTANNCTLSNNTAINYGGGAYLADGTMNNCRLAANHANTQGGGVHFAAGSPVLNNCLLLGNTTVNYGGNVYFSGCGRVNNCTIVAGGGASGVRMDNGGSMTNCIVWGNTNSDVSILTTGTVRYTSSNPKQLGEGNIGDNPMFVDTNTANYHLSNSSTCVNRGTNQSGMTSAFDLDGRRRLDKFSGLVDMGCYEYIPSGAMCSFH